MDLLRSMALPVVIGVGLGALLARYASDDALKLVWVGAATLMAIKLIFGRNWLLGDTIPGQPFRALYGGFVGLVSTLMSIGGGVFITALMTIYGQPIQRAVATSSGFGPLIAIPGALGFIWAGWGVRRPAAGLARLRQPARRPADHPDQRRRRPVRRAPGPWHLAPHARARVRAVPFDRGPPLPAQPGRLTGARRRRNHCIAGHFAGVKRSLET